MSTGQRLRLCGDRPEVTKGRTSAASQGNEIGEIVKTILVASLLFALIADEAAASERGDLAYAANQARHKVVMRYGQDAAGRDIVKYGIRFTAADHSRQTRHAKMNELREYTAQLHRIMRPPPRPQMHKYVGPPPQAPAGTQTTYGTPPASIAQCESGGNPGAVSPDGTYRGKWQFDQQTWESVGGTGDPAAAPEAVQDRLAGKLYAQRGAAPWPVCGR